MERLQLGHRSIEFEVRRGKSSKYIRLSFKRNLQLEVVLPRDFYLDVQALLMKKREWIERKYDELADGRVVFDGKRVLVKGEYRELNILPTRDAGEERVQLLGDRVMIYANGMGDALGALREWMKAQTMTYAAGKASIYAEKLGVRFRNLYVRGMSGWGHCTKLGDIVLNSQLIALPEALAEYVLLHELAHLRVFNHSKRFLAKLAHVCPDYMERQTVLKSFIPAMIVPT